METAVHAPYHNLIRKWHKKTLRSLPRAAAHGGSTTCRTSTTDTKGTRKASSAFPPFIDLTEEQPLCLDPISVLNIPRARYHSVRHITLCRKGITELHPNIQYLENLDTLIIRHNRLSRITNLLPRRRTEDHEGPPLCTARGCQLLRRLYASHNCLQALDGDVCGLRHLEVLLLAHNQLDNLHAVAAQLRPLSWLRELDLRGNPLCDTVGYRLFLIHALPQVEVLDRRQVRHTEREEAAARFAKPKPQRAISASHSADIKQTALLHHHHHHHHPTQQEHQQQQQQQQEEEEHQQKQRRLKKCSSVVTFKRAYSPRSDEEEENAHRPKSRSARPFAPSSCVRLLDARVRRDTARAAQRATDFAQRCAADTKRRADLHAALHATFDLSRRGLPLCAERWDPIAKRLSRAAAAQDSTDISPSTTTTTTTAAAASASAQREARRCTMAHQRTSSSALSGGSNTAGGDTAEKFPAIALDIPALCTRLPSLAPEKSARSVLYDALLDPESVSERVGSNAQCVPAARRLRRIREALSHTAALFSHPADMSAKETAEMLLAVQEAKDALVPEPWEHTAQHASFGASVPNDERVEYVHRAAVQFMLPAEFRALEGQFLVGTAALHDSAAQQAQQAQQQQQQQRRGGRKDRRTAAQGGEGGPTNTTAVGIITGQPFTPLTSSGALLLQQLPLALTSGVEIGPADRNTIVRVMNMFDGESGAWALCVERMTEAIRADVVGQCAELSSTPSRQRDLPPHSPSLTQQEQQQQQQQKQKQQQQQQKGKKQKAKGERRGGPAAMATALQTETDALLSGMDGSSVRAPPLALSAVLLGLVRYVPFAESRRDFFRARSVATGVKGENGAGGEAAREWFAKAQWAAAHCERLREGMREAGMTEEDALTKLIPLSCMLASSTREVGSLFRERQEKRQ